MINSIYVAETSSIIAEHRWVARTMHNGKYTIVLDADRLTAVGKLVEELERAGACIARSVTIHTSPLPNREFVYE